MPRVVADISMSLDGFVTGPDPDLEHGLGRGGEPLPDWAVGSDDEVDAAVLREATEATVAVVMGRRCSTSWTGPGGGATRWALAPGWQRRRRSSSSPTPPPSRFAS
jgi:hypothetical protein